MNIEFGGKPLYALSIKTQLLSRHIMPITVHSYCLTWDTYCMHFFSPPFWLAHSKDATSSCMRFKSSFHYALSFCWLAHVHRYNPVCPSGSYQNPDEFEPCIKCAAGRFQVWQPCCFVLLQPCHAFSKPQYEGYWRLCLAFAWHLLYSFPVQANQGAAQCTNCFKVSTFQ